MNELDTLMHAYNRRRIRLLGRQGALSPEERGELVALQHMIGWWVDLRWPLPRVPDADAEEGGE